MIEFKLNGESVQTDDDPSTPLLWVVRDTFKLKGSKFGCGAGLCGACTMHIDGGAQQTCILPIAAVAGKTVTTIEGLGTPDRLHPLQQAFTDNHALQCGYCTPGFLMLATGVLEANPDISDDDLNDALASNLCRCTGYQNIIKAVRQARDQMKAG